MRRLAFFLLPALLLTVARADPVADAPTGLQATYDPASGLVHLAWTAAADPLGFSVYRDGALVGTADGTAFTDAPPAGGPAFAYVVTANGPGGQSLPSNPAVVAVDPCPPVNVGANPDPPYVAHIDWDCLDRLLHP